MQVSYDQTIRDKFPELKTGIITVCGVSFTGNVSAWTAHFQDIAAARLAGTTEGAFPEIQAWRKAFTRMGHKPTQYRSASEALLRRFRSEGTLPSIHPLVDLCNSVSIAFAIPVAIFDLSKIEGSLTVRHADGNELYESFNGAIEHPEKGEVIFSDISARAHARRWVNRQSGYSAVREETRHALIIAEALHEEARDDVARLSFALRRTIAETWPIAMISEGMAL
jgi:DNA/RNA-binding domain of Phe-tRNA-synthetase-like protein